MPLNDRSTDPSRWMHRVLERHALARRHASEKNIHKLRVALRRCRTIAEAIRRVDPHPAWKAMRRQAKQLFGALGPAREAQVLARWVERLSEKPDLLAKALLHELRSLEDRGVRQSKKALAAFDRGKWKKLARKIRRRYRAQPYPKLVASHLILERWAEATEDNLTALREDRIECWHRARISIKRFRYTWEAFSRATLEPVLKELQFAQDSLGDVHDLDELQKRFEGLAPAGSDALSTWTRRIQKRRASLLAEYRQRTMQRQALWNRLRERLVQGARLEAAGVARLVAQTQAQGWSIGLEPRRFALAQKMLEQQLAAASELERKRAKRLLAVAVRIDPGPDADEDRRGQDPQSLDRPLGWSREDMTILRGVLAADDSDFDGCLKAQERALAEDVRTALEASWI